MNWQLNIGSKCNSLILQKVLSIRVHLFSFKNQYDTNYNTIIMVHSLLSRVHACIFRVFTKEQYFDSDGLFFSTVYSTPVLFNCLLLLVRVLSPPVLIYTYSMEPFYVCKFWGSKYCPNVLTCFTNIQGKLQSWELYSCKF